MNLLAPLVAMAVYIAVLSVKIYALSERVESLATKVAELNMAVEGRS